MLHGPHLLFLHRGTNKMICHYLNTSLHANTPFNNITQSSVASPPPLPVFLLPLPLPHSADNQNITRINNEPLSLGGNTTRQLLKLIASTMYNCTCIQLTTDHITIHSVSFLVLITEGWQLVNKLEIFAFPLEVLKSKMGITVCEEGDVILLLNQSNEPIRLHPFRQHSVPFLRKNILLIESVTQLCLFQLISLLFSRVLNSL